MAEIAEIAARAPIVIDLGKVKRKRIKQLERGGGKLMEEVEQALREVRAGLGDDAGGKELVPVVFLYRKRPRRKRMFPFGLRI